MTRKYIVVYVSFYVFLNGKTFVLFIFWFQWLFAQIVVVVVGDLVAAVVRVVALLAEQPEKSNHVH